MNYKQYLKSSTAAKVSLILLVIDVIAAIYITSQAARFTGAAGALTGAVITMAVSGLVWLCHYKKPVAAIIIEILLMAVLALGVYAAGKVGSWAGDISRTAEYENVQIVALKDSPIESGDDFSSYVMGYSADDDGAYEKSSKILEDNSKTVKRSKPSESTEVLYDELLNGSVDLMVLTSNTRSDLSIIDEDYETKIKVILEGKFEVESATLKAVDITKEPFTIYLCGADLSSGEDINSTGRGDVNILLTVNPNTKQVNMQAIPRDTFVYIPCRGGSSKLSYSGWWGGVQSSIESIEDKFDIEINYYAKINFNGLVDLVDALGGVTVYSHYTYTAGDYTFVKGYNEVNGESALMFARARKMLPENELSRGQHQMELIKGIFRKFAENPSYSNAMAIMDSLANNFTTNLPERDFADAVALVIELLPQLENMENHSMEGTYQWHYDEIRKGYYQYYFYPEESEIKRVKDDINAVLEGE